MTIDDLNEYGIIHNGKINDKDLGLLILKYNEMYLTDETKKKKFEELTSKILTKFNNEEEEKFLMTCLAICDGDVQKEYISQKKSSDSLLKIHNLVSKSKMNEFIGKENIRQARSLAESEDNLKNASQKYQEIRDQFKYLEACATDEGVFDVFYSGRLMGKIDREDAKKMIEANYEKAKENFASQQSKYFAKFINYHVNADARVLGREIG